MNKKQLAGKLAKKEKLTKAQAEQIIDSTLDFISQALIGGDKVRLVGFGNFVVRKRKGRIGRNPQTGEEIKIPARTVPVFRPGALLKDSVQKAR